MKFTITALILYILTLKALFEENAKMLVKTIIIKFLLFLFLFLHLYGK